MSRRRLFFALRPTPECCEKIAVTAAYLGLDGKRVITKNYHITVLFLGAVAEQKIKPIISAAATISLPSFTICLDSSGAFTRAKVAWLGMSQVPQTLYRLNQKLKSQVEIHHPGIETRAYKPHLTLARKISHPGHQKLLEQPFIITWPVNFFVLMESIDSRPGIRYNEMEHFKLDPS